MFSRLVVPLFLVSGVVLLPPSAAAQAVESGLVVDAGVQYFRQAEYQQAIALLSTVDRLLDRSQQGIADRSRAKFYLALSHAANGDARRAQATFRSLYESDLKFQPVERLPDQLVQMMERERAAVMQQVCPETACHDVLESLRDGIFTAGQINPGCPCVDDAVEVGVKAAQELLLARDFGAAHERTVPLIELRPEHAEARLVADLARAGCEVTEGLLFDQWERQFATQSYADARQTAEQLRSVCTGSESDAAQRISDQYRDALATQVSRWQSACAGDGPGRERRLEYDAARAAVIALDDGTGINAQALAATEDSQCSAVPCQFVVPYKGVVDKPPFRQATTVTGLVEVALELDTNGRIVNPNDPAWFKVSGTDNPNAVRAYVEDWLFLPTRVPVCTVISLDFRAAPQN